MDDTIVIIGVILMWGALAACEVNGLYLSLLEGLLPFVIAFFIYCNEKFRLPSNINKIKFIDYGKR